MKLLLLFVIFNIFSIAHADCYINKSLSCSGGSTYTWPKRTYSERAFLLFSDEVQLNSEYCHIFSEIILEECGEKLVQSVFVDANKKVSHHMVQSSSLKNTLSNYNLPQPFLDYFNPNVTLGSWVEWVARATRGCPTLKHGSGFSRCIRDLQLSSKCSHQS